MEISSTSSSSDPEAPFAEKSLTAVKSHALGVRLQLPDAVLGLPQSSSYESAKRESTFRDISAGEAEDYWNPRDVKRIVDNRRRDGTPVRTVDYDPALGYRYWGKDRGECYISADGRGVLCRSETVDTALWERYVIGQILPFVAPVQGLEVMHGSAVEVDGKAVAFLSGSQGGKTSLATQLILKGATPIADDVLALERDDQGLLIHPGPAILGIRHREAERLGQDAIAKLGPVIAENDKEVVVGVARAEEETRLGSMYFIRHDDVDEVSIEPCDSPERLIGSTFNTVLTSPGRMERMLDICLDISKSVNATQVVVPRDVEVDELADRIVAHLDSRG